MSVTRVTKNHNLVRTTERIRRRMDRVHRRDGHLILCVKSIPWLNHRYSLRQRRAQALAYERGQTELGRSGGDITQVQNSKRLSI